MIDYDTGGYKIAIHCGGAGYYIHGKTNDDAMKAHILKMIKAVGFEGGSDVILRSSILW